MSEDLQAINWATAIEKRALKKGRIDVLPETSSWTWWEDGKPVGVTRVYLPSNTHPTGHVKRIRT